MAHEAPADNLSPILTVNCFSFESRPGLIMKIPLKCEKIIFHFVNKRKKARRGEKCGGARQKIFSHDEKQFSGTHDDRCRGDDGEGGEVWGGWE